MKPILLIITLILTSFSLQAQTDFPAMKQQFLDYRKANNQDSALYIARKMNQLALEEQTDSSYWYALSMRYMGNPHYSWGNTDSTIFYWSKSVELFEKYHPTNPDFASSLNNLGVLYSDMGDYKAVEPLYKKAIEIRKQALGEEHPDYAQSINNLAVLYRAQGRYDDAEPMYDEALSICRRVLGADHPDTAESLNNLAVLYRVQGRYSEAAPLLKEAVEIMEQVLGSEHPNTKIVRENYEGLLAEMKESGR